MCRHMQVRVFFAGCDEYGASSQLFSRNQELKVDALNRPRHKHTSPICGYYDAKYGFVLLNLRNVDWICIKGKKSFSLQPMRTCLPQLNSHLQHFIFSHDWTTLTKEEKYCKIAHCCNCSHGLLLNV